MPASLLRLLRLGFAALTFAAIVTQFVISERDRPEFDPVNFFSFFTIQSNLYVATLFLYLAIVPAAARSPRLDLLRGAGTLYMVVTGIVVILFLSGEDLQVGEPWVDTVVHQVMPIVLVLDWLIDPPRHRLARRAIWLWLLYPAAYAVYSLVRGEFVDWYPYPFLNVTEKGYDGVLGGGVFIFAGIAIAAVVVRFVGNWRAASRR